MTRFELKIVFAMLLMAVIPLVTSFVLVGQVIRVSERVADGQTVRLRTSLTHAADAYHQLFALQKDAFRLKTQVLARDAVLQQALAAHDRAALVAELDRLRDDTAHYLEIRDEHGLTLAAAGMADVPQGERALEIVEPLPPSPYALRAIFITPTEPFARFALLDQTQREVTGIASVRVDLARFYHVAFVVIFGAALLLAFALGLWIARRTTRRVAVLAGATRRVAAGDLDTEVALQAGDELGELSASFNEMVRELRENRDRIAYLEKIGAWQEIARRLAHEIKNPLTPIQLAVQELRTRYGAADSAAFSRLLDEAHEIVQEEISGLRRLVEEFSAFAKLPAVRPERSDLNQLIDDFLRSHIEVAQQARLRWTALRRPVMVNVDRMLIKHALLNLTQNAIQAAEQAGMLAQLTIALTARVDGRQNTVVLTVADNGPGMSAETQRRAFEPYYTTKEHGTGLGLAIVKKTILEHGGTIRLGSRPGGGSEFTILLPIAKNPTTPA